MLAIVLAAAVPASLTAPAPPAHLKAPPAHPHKSPDALLTTHPAPAPPGRGPKHPPARAAKSRGAERGAGPPARPSPGTVHYSGWPTEGQMFDSSVLRGEPAEFRLDEVVPGWTEGLELMTEGEQVRFW